MKISAATFLFLATVLHLRADAQSDAVAKLQQVPSPPLVVTMDQAAGSPIVMLSDKGAFINKAKTPVPFNQILLQLAALPKEAWPDGRLVLYSAAPSGIVGVVAPAKAVSDQVEEDLEEANIRLVRR